MTRRTTFPVFERYVRLRGGMLPPWEATEPRLARAA